MKTVNSLATFTHQYNLSKTLRFELNPIGRTAEWIEKHDIIGVKDGELIGKDAEKAKHYKYAKRLLDAMHRLFIEDTFNQISDETIQQLENKFSELRQTEAPNVDQDLRKLFKKLLDTAASQWIAAYQQDMLKFWQEDICDLEKKIAEESNNQRKKGFQSAIKAIQKKIDAPEKTIKKSDVSVMHSNEESLHLLEWKIRTGQVGCTFKDLDQGDSKNPIPIHVLCDYLRNFYKFSTYFSGFNKNRANVYDLSGDKATSIINRTVNENLAFHFANLAKWETIKKSLVNYAEAFAKKGFDPQSLLKKIEDDLKFSADEFFTVKIFCCVMSQSGIDRYNEILGGRPDLEGGEKIQGINEFINLCRQQAGAKRRQFPPMQELYKQILSKSDRTFIPEFSDDRDLLDAISNLHQDYFVQTNEKGQTLLARFAKENQELVEEIKDDYEKLYIAADKISFLSNRLTGQWNNLNLELLELLGETEFNKRKNKYFSFAEIEAALKAGASGERFTVKPEFVGQCLVECFNIIFSGLVDKAGDAWKELFESGILELKELDKNRVTEGDKGFEQIAKIKDFMDAALAVAGHVRDWRANKAILGIDGRNREWYDQLDNFVASYRVMGLYNMVRNHVTKKPTATEKLKINFENATLLDGWDRNKETANYGILLKREGDFYLGIMTADSNQIFDYEASPSDSAKKAKEKVERRAMILAEKEDPTYQKLNYKLLPGANKMLPKVFFAASNKKLFNPPKNITTIKEQKLYSKENIEKHGIKNLHDYIDFCKESLVKHPEWSKAFNFSFNPTENYQSIDQFYREVEQQGYRLSFDNIKESFINEKVEAGELYLFQIYNKDFSKTKKPGGRDNLHTIYWKGLFAPENLASTALKLNGQAEIFFRQASIKYSAEKMKTGHHAQDLKEKFAYPIIKDRRFTQNKFFLHCPITLNFSAPSVPGSFNNKIRGFLKGNPDVNIIGIDRGEKHLLYYSVINQAGDIIEQGSLNEIANGFIPDGETKERSINYHAKLEAVQKNRDKARKSWATIENIKELKAGYLSQVVHQLAKLIVKHNAIVVLEDLNMGFKRGRFGVEKQVYQKFERALIDKLNYLVFKDCEDRKQAGHFLNGYQLTNKFESFKKLGTQSGILFYTTASYTSTTDPVTGFLKNVYAKYQSVEKSLAFWKSFDRIHYNPTADRFEFTYTIGKIASKSMHKESGEDRVNKKTWTVCSCVTRSRYVKAIEKQSEEQKQNTSAEQIGKQGRHETFFVTDELKTLLNDNGIDYANGVDLRSTLLAKSAKTDASFHKTMVYLFNAIMTMRVTDDDKEKGTPENDFILSPVEPFFDSRSANSAQPENGDANGAYNIARKGICILQKINEADDVAKVTPSVSKQEWQNFAQG